MNNKLMLRELREKKGLSRKYVSDRLKITGDHLNVIERGSSKLSLEQGYILSTLYDVSMEEIYKATIK